MCNQVCNQVCNACAISHRQLGLIPHGQLHALQQVVVQPIQRARKAVNADAHHWHRLGLFRAGQSGITRAISLAESRTRLSCARPACQALQYSSPPDAWHTWVAKFEPLRTVANESPDMRRNDSAACAHVTAPLHCCSRQAMPGCTAKHDVESSFASMSRYSVGQNATCTPQYPQVTHKRTAVLLAQPHRLPGQPLVQKRHMVCLIHRKHDGHKHRSQLRLRLWRRCHGCRIGSCQLLHASTIPICKHSITGRAQHVDAC